MFFTCAPKIHINIFSLILTLIKIKFHKKIFLFNLRGLAQYKKKKHKC